ncbi:hypothetical protein D3C80_1892140 [compost metagenome]
MFFEALPLLLPFGVALGFGLTSVLTGAAVSALAVLLASVALGVSFIVVFVYLMFVNLLSGITKSIPMLQHIYQIEEFSQIFPFIQAH